MSLEIITPAPPDRFATTSVSTRIEDAVEFAFQTHSAVAVRGAPGVGKSSTIGRMLVSDTFRVAAFEVPAGSGSQNNLVKWVCTAIDVPRWEQRHIGAIIARIRDDQRFNIDVLVVDEIQNADAAGIRMLLSLNEHAGLPLVLVGNEEALTRRGGSTAAWAQIDDRVTMTVELQASLASDIEAVARAWGAVEDDVLKIVLAYAEARSLRKVAQLLRTAHAFSQVPGVLTIEAIETALRVIGAPIAKRGEAT